MTTPTVKEEARKLVERLPDDATWEDLMYQIYVRQAVEAGLKDSREGRVVSSEESRKRFPPVAPPIQPLDEWERQLRALAIDCGVSQSNEALSREELYD